MTSKETYTMAYKCSNCFKEFRQSIPFGRKAINNGGECPYCGVTFAELSNHTHKPFEYVDIE